MPNGDLIAVGSFQNGGAGTLRRVARWNGSTWSEVAGGLDNTAAAIAAAPDGTVLVGGSFTQAGGSVSGYLARLTTTCPASATSVAPGCPSSGGGNQLIATTLPWTGGTCRGDATGLPNEATVAIVVGFATIAPVPLPLLPVPAGNAACNLHVDPEGVGFTAAVAGGATFTIDLPNDPLLAGATFFTQLVVLETSGGQYVDTTATNALRFVAGSF